VKKTRWRAILRSKGYKYNKKWDFWYGKHDIDLVFAEELRKDHFLYSLLLQEAPVCEYCNGSGWENADGWIHGCTGCEAVGKCTSNIQIGRLVD